MIALYYCYPPGGGIPPHELENHAAFHASSCRRCGDLGGRVRVSTEGINGVLSGLESRLREHEAELRAELARVVIVAGGGGGDRGRRRRGGGEGGEGGGGGRDDDDDDDGDDDEDPTAGWFDVKYCMLRDDVPVEKQLFDDLSVKITREVVSLIEPSSSSSIAAAGGGGGKKGRARCRQRRKQKRREEQRRTPVEGGGSTTTIAGRTSTPEEGGVGRRRDGGDEEAGHDDDEDGASGSGRRTMIGGGCGPGSSSFAVDDDGGGGGGCEVGVALPMEGYEKREPAMHLSPDEWNERLLRLSSPPPPTTTSGSGSGGGDAILLDARNVYETRVGHFAVPNLGTLLPNTRKFSSLPAALNTEMAASALSGKEVYMYCTGEWVVPSPGPFSLVIQKRKRGGGGGEGNDEDRNFRLFT